MTAVLKHWRESATLILATSKISKRVGINLTKSPPSETTAGNDFTVQNRDSAGTEDDIQDDFEVLMMKRSSSSKFMPNLHVFPGGVAEDSDFSSNWISVFKKLGSDSQKQLFNLLTAGCHEAVPMIKRNRSPEFSLLPADVAFRICAIREAFEESGVLLAKPAELSKKLVKQHVRRLESNSHPEFNSAFVHSDMQVIKKWRDRVNKEPSQFLDMCLQLDLVPEIWSLYEWANWLTPIHGKENRRRFDTIFYVCCIDHKPDAEQDHGETVNALWASPKSLLLAHVEQGGGLAPPQIYELARFLHFNTAEDLLRSVSQPDRDRVGRIYPVVGQCKDVFFSMNPGDCLYPQNPDLIAQKPIKFDNTIAELNSLHPGPQDRIVISDDLKLNTPSFSAVPRHGHVGPRMDFIRSVMKAKL